MNTSDFSDLLKDEKFVQWVTNPNAQLDHYWENWINSHPNRKEDVEIARNFISSLEYRQEYRLSENDYQRSLYKLMEFNDAQKTGNRRINYFTLARVVGIAAMVVLVFTVLFNMYGPNVEDRPSKIELITKQTEYGQKRSVRLPDGTAVMLNAGSVLTYEKPFLEKTRKVTLTGEAFFDVRRDETRPFIVKTASVETEVLGTSFNVRAYPEEEEISVSVLTGKVMVSSDKDQHGVTLTPLKEAVYNYESRSIGVRNFDQQLIFGWKDGIIEFDNVSIDQVLVRLERWYGVEFVVSNNVSLKGHYRGVYKDASLEGILDGLSFTTGFSYELNGKKVLIKPKEE